MVTTNSGLSIGEAATSTGVSIDTLRYYEKIALLTGIKRNAGGKRLYSSDNINRILFIRRAQSMNFSLQEIKSLLIMRNNPNRARKSVRQLTRDKLKDINQRIDELQALKKELSTLVDLCADSEGSDKACPILSHMDEH